MCIVLCVPSILRVYTSILICINNSYFLSFDFWHIFKCLKFKFHVNAANGNGVDVTYEERRIWWMQVYPKRVNQSNVCHNLWLKNNFNNLLFLHDKNALFFSFQE